MCVVCALIDIFTADPVRFERVTSGASTHEGSWQILAEFKTIV
jgi:hypothetical protein